MVLKEKKKKKAKFLKNSELRSQVDVFFKNKPQRYRA